MVQDELSRFIEEWDRESEKTLRLLEILPAHQYDFRPWKEGRSLGELAWHIAEVEAYPAYGIEQGRLDLTHKPPGIERPREVAALAPEYRRVHHQAAARLKRLDAGIMERTLPWFDGTPMTVSRILWDSVLAHHIHHRGQLVYLTRLAGGVPPGMYGPTREEMAALMEKMKG